MQDKKVVFVSGYFNIVHPGHLRLFRFAKEQADHLIVGVFSDRLANASAHIEQELRLEGVKSNSWVDEVILIDEPLEEVLLRIKPDCVVKGKEHENRFNSEKTVLDGYGAKLIFSSGETVFSSMDLLKKEFDEKAISRLDFPSTYCERHSISKNSIENIVTNFSKLKVCVIGELIVDEYITCQALGMSQEDPTLVVTPIDSTKFVGGAGIVAAHAKGLGAEVTFITVTGNDAAKAFAAEKLVEYGVNFKFVDDESRPTPLKQRYRSKGKSLLRVSHLHQAAISKELQEEIFKNVEHIIGETNLLVFSDFNYGCLPQELVDRITALAKKHNVFLAADSQSSSQVGDIGRFREVNLLNATEREARISAKNHQDGLVILAEQLRGLAKAGNIFLKLGEEGLLIHAQDEEGKQPWLTDRLDALNRNPKDVAGAGDSLLIAGAMALSSGANIWSAALIGSIAAGIQVGRVGNIPLSDNDIVQELGY